MALVKAVLVGGGTILIGESYLVYSYFHAPKTTIKDAKVTNYEEKTLGKFMKMNLLIHFLMAI